MGIQLVSRAAGVYETEVNLSAYIISSLSSTGCLPVISGQGQSIPYYVSGWSQYLAMYGNPNPTVSMSGYAAQDFLLGGAGMWCLRVPGTGNNTGAYLLYLNAGGTQILSVPVVTPDPQQNPVTNWTGLLTTAGVTGTAVALIYPNFGPGSYSSTYSIGITSYSALIPAGTSATSSTSASNLIAGSYSYQVAAVFPGNLVGAASTASNVSISANVAPQIQWSLVPNAIGYNIYGRAAGSLGLIATVGASTTSYLDVSSTNVPSSTVLPLTAAQAAAAMGSNAAFQVNIYNNQVSTSTPLEQFTCTLYQGVSSSGMQTEIAANLNGFSQYVNCISNAAALSSPPAVGTQATIALGVGSSGSAPTSAQIVTAMQVFSNFQLYAVNILMDSGLGDAVSGKGFDALAQSRLDTCSLLSVPATSQLTAQSAADYRNITLNLNSTWSALFSPDQLEADSITNQQLYVPLVGTIGALLAHTDASLNPGYSTAGLNRGQLPKCLKPRIYYNGTTDANLLHSAQVNYVLNFVGQGIALWEQQTLSGNTSALSWLSVRRAVNVIKTALYRYLQYGLQETPTVAFQRALTNAINTYLTAQVNANMISYGVCEIDAANNPPAAVNAGILGINVVIIPEIPINQIQVTVAISKQGVSLTEVLSTLNA